MGGELDTILVEHFRRWIRAGLTGCEFAKVLASQKERLAFQCFIDVELPSPEFLTTFLDASAELDQVVFFLFPHIRDAQGVRKMLNAVRADQRWNIEETPVSETLARVNVAWTTKSGDRTHPMGFAPFPTMPVTRRAPYVALGFWPGGQLNPFSGQPPTPRARRGEVSFLDIPHGLAESPYQKRWEDTVEAVGGLMRAPPDHASQYRETAFVLPAL